jgi:hypothetical protein
MIYRTTELEVAAFLKAKGHRVQEAVPQGRIVTFSFDDSVAPEVDAYFAGAPVPAKELFEAHRCLRALIQQVKNHKNNTTEQNRYDIRTQQS